MAFMKIKQFPEDFIVEEVSSRKLKPAGPYQVFLMEKTGLDTFGAKRIIGKEFKVASQEIGLAGLKDKHALTRQYVSFPSRYRIPDEWSQQSIKLKRVGFADSPILLGDLDFNRFIITIRGIKEFQVEKVVSAAKDFLACGVPNYFDSQRFGSLRGTQSFIASFLIKGDWEGALKTVLTSSTRHDQAQVRHCREHIRSHWGDWKECLAACAKSPKARREKRIIEFLKDHPKDFKAAFSLVERELQKLYVAAYQSYLWNETVKVVLNRQHPPLKLKQVKYEAGLLLFPLSVPAEASALFSRLDVPLLNPGTLFERDEVRFAALRTLKDHGLSLEMLDVAGPEFLKFRQGSRRMWIIPRQVSAPSASADERNSDQKSKLKKIEISFELPPGSYATVLLKAIGVEKRGRR